MDEDHSVNLEKRRPKPTPKRRRQNVGNPEQEHCRGVEDPFVVLISMG